MGDAVGAETVEEVLDGLVVRECGLAGVLERAPVGAVLLASVGDHCSEGYVCCCCDD